jgi:hypothetical protein
VVNAAIVRRDIVYIEENAFLYCQEVSRCSTEFNTAEGAHRLKLVTGVETSTRPPRRIGNAGKTVNKTSLAAAAAPYRSSFCWIAAMFAVIELAP